MDSSKQYLLFRTDILPKTVVRCHCQIWQNGSDGSPIWGLNAGIKFHGLWSTSGPSPRFLILLLLLRHINWLKEKKTAEFLTLISFVSLLCCSGICSHSTAILAKEFQLYSFSFPQSWPHSDRRGGGAPLEPLPPPLKSWITSKPSKLGPPNLVTFPKIYLGAFWSHRDPYASIDVTMVTEFWQPCFSKFVSSLKKIGFISIFTDWIIILHLIQHHFIKVPATFNEIKAS